MRVLSVVVPDTLPQARVLARSLRRHEPDWKLEVALIGSAKLPEGVAADLSLVSAAEELEIDLDPLLARHHPATLVRLLVPLLLGKRLREGSEPLLHLPPTVWVVGSLEPLARLVADRGVLLAPRLSGEMPEDGLEPSRSELAAIGRIAPDLMAVDPSSAAPGFLRWWIERSEAVLGAEEVRPRSHAEDDAEWLLRTLELAPARFATATLDDPGCNVSVWNLHERSLEETVDGVVVDGRWPLRFMDLAGFEPDHPYRLAPTSSRVRLSRIPAVRELIARYARELIEAGWHDLATRVRVGGWLANGLVFDETMACLYAAAGVLGEDFGDLVSTEGTEAFMAWLRDPISPWTSDGISRYVVQRVIRERPDVLAAFPDMYGIDSDRFAAWWRRFGREELHVPNELLPAPAVSNGRAAALAPAAPAQASSSGHFATAAAPPPVELAPASAEASAAATHSLETTSTPRPPTASDGASVGVRVTGYLSHVLGLGSAARAYVNALAAAGVPLTTVSVPLEHQEASEKLSTEYGRQSYEEIVHEGGHGFELVCVNADELPRVVDRLGEDYFEGPRIGVWGWETNSIPRRWKTAFALVDEIWVYSQFMARNIGAVAPVPVIALPPPVQASPRSRGSLRLGVPPGFLFLFVFDYLSTIQRKNPVGLIEAFKRAFSPGEGPQLLIKTINAPRRPDAEEEVLWAVHRRPDIHVIDRSLTSEEKDALMFACDCYVSLHRSEGFGLTLAEAMAIGKPVIGTGYSGNVDFMNPDNSFLVEYEITQVGAGNEIYPADGEWADPDLEHAARLMRQVYDHPEEAARIGARAREDVARTLSPEATGAAMRSRLQELAARRRDRRDPPSRVGRAPRGAGARA